MRRFKASSTFTKDARHLGLWRAGLQLAKGYKLDPNTYVKIYRISNNGERIVETNAKTYEDFIRELSPAVLSALEATSGDQEYTLDYILPAIIELACKLKGYKAEKVLEQRVLLSGSVWPDEVNLIASNGWTSPGVVTTLEEAADKETASVT